MVRRIAFNMIDITKLQIGDTFYRVYGYEFWYKMEVVKAYDFVSGKLAAKCIEGDTENIDDVEWLEVYEEEKYFCTYEEAERDFKEAEQERLKYLSNINHLLDELYAEIANEKSNHARLYGEAIERFKEKNK